jgi:cold shock protein
MLAEIGRQALDSL